MDIQNNEKFIEIQVKREDRNFTNGPNVIQVTHEFLWIEEDSLGNFSKEFGRIQEYSKVSNFIQFQMNWKECNWIQEVIISL